MDIADPAQHLAVGWPQPQHALDVHRQKFGLALLIDGHRRQRELQSTIEYRGMQMPLTFAHVVGVHGDPTPELGARGARPADGPERRPITVPGPCKSCVESIDVDLACVLRNADRLHVRGGSVDDARMRAGMPQPLDFSGGRLGADLHGARALVHRGFHQFGVVEPEQAFEAHIGELECGFLRALCGCRQHQLHISRSWKYRAVVEAMVAKKGVRVRSDIRQPRRIRAALARSEQRMRRAAQP